MGGSEVRKCGYGLPRLSASRWGVKWPPAKRRDWIPAWLSVGVIALVAAVLWFALSTGFITFGTVAMAAYVLAFALTGTVAWYRRPEYLTGRLMVLAAYLTLISPLQRFPDVGALFAIGTSLNGLQEAVLGYLLLTYPSGRAGRGFMGTLARFVVVAAPVLAIGDLLTRQNGTPPCFVPVCSDQPNPFLVVDLGAAVVEFSVVTLGVMAAVILIAVAWRFVTAHGAARRALAPILIAGALTAVGVGIRQTFVGDVVIANVARSIQFLIPIALGVGFVRSRMARAGVADLVLRAGRSPSLLELEAAIRRTLHDPSARLLRWSRAGDSYLDTAGRSSKPQAGSDRQVTLIPADGGPFAAVEHDPVLAAEGDLLPSVVAAVRIVLENDRLATSVQAQTADAARLPSGVVTLMSTDIEGSTELLDRLRERYADLLSELRQLLRRTLREAGGTEIDSRADEFFAAIPDASAAVTAALSIQRQLAVHPWPGGVRVRIRIGLHTGEPAHTHDGYVGMDVHLAARVGAAGHGSQIIVSDSTREAVRQRLAEGAFEDLGRYRLKGIPRSVRLYQLSEPGASVVFAPLRADVDSA